MQTSSASGTRGLAYNAVVKDRRRPRMPRNQSACLLVRWRPCPAEIVTVRGTPRAMSSSAAVAVRNVGDSLAIALEYNAAQGALVIADERSSLARLLVHAYRACLPGATLLLFDEVGPDVVKAAFARLREHDLVVLIQSSVFRIPEFRTRVELFKQGIKVIEHSNLERVAEADIEHY